MKMELLQMIYYDSAHGQISWNEELQAVVMEWKGFAHGDEFQTILIKGIELLEQKKSGKLLMDSRKGSAIKAEDQEWVAQQFVARAYGAGLRYLAMLLPKSMIAKLSLDRTIDGLGELPYELVNFSEMEEAVQWLTHPHAKFVLHIYSPFPIAASISTRQLLHCMMFPGGYSNSH
ncbi:hypothetical protein ACFOLF_36270 [Paenibacillus sepulcri]|uniref:STAS/SEC14 domain-containing protein n=1 Tax=Paenibacillus sepulcri TaxID=359917 RepID=A0ABS7C2N9_9BACL|nr:hypothetical protein [Paenibacillus sepulcri]